MLNFPSPSQSPATGIDPAGPNWNWPASGAPEELLLRRKNVAVRGSKAPMVKVPLPSQSPAMGIQLASPNANGAMSGGAPSVLDRKKTPSRPPDSGFWPLGSTAPT